MSSHSGDAEPVHWSSYWARGCLTSLPQDFRGNYDGEIAEFWQRQFARLPESARILDVCTGNGAVALLATRFASERQRHFHVTGVDAAAIHADAIRSQHPELAGLVERIEFRARCRFEDLDQPDARFDLITSQYGIEYCDWERAAEKVVDLLGPGGVLAMVSHAVSTDILRTMEAEFEEYNALVRLQVLPGLEAWANREIGPARLRAILQEALPELQRNYRRSGSGLYRYVLGLAERMLGAADREIEAGRGPFAEAQRQLRDGHARLEDLLQVNRAIAAAPDWAEVFARHGLEPVETGSLHYRDSHRAGDFHVYRKPAR